MFSLSGAGDSNAPRDGNQEDKPLFLDGVKKADFRSFLNILSARHYEAVTAGNVVGKTNLLLTRFPLYPPMTKDEWIAALRLSHMWGFEIVRTKAIEMLEADATVNMIQKLKLANECQITKWVRPAYQYLLTRKEELKETEVPWLGVDFVQKVAKAREERTKLYLLRVLSCDLSLPLCPTCRQGTLKLDDFAKSSEPPQPGSGHQEASKTWTLRCSTSTVPGANHYSYSINSWTLEELMHLEYAKVSTYPLIKGDVERLIDRFLPIS